jgi:Flp pilus assembly protein TadB
MSALVAIVIVVAVAGVALPLRPTTRPRTPGADALEAGPTDDAPLRFLEDVERDLRTGVGLHIATLTALRRHPSTLATLRRALAGGATLAAALEALRPTDPAELLVVQTLRACERTGGRMGTAVDRAVLVLRERRAWERERHVQAAQARLSATVLTLVPLVFAAWGFVTSERIRDAYTQIPLCASAAAVGVLVNVLGWVWMRRLVTGAAT